MPDPNCPECKGTGAVNLGDDCDYQCPACVAGWHIISRHGAVVIEKYVVPQRLPPDQPADSEGGEQ